MDGRRVRRYVWSANFGVEVGEGGGGGGGGGQKGPRRVGEGTQCCGRSSEGKAGAVQLDVGSGPRVCVVSSGVLSAEERGSTG